MTQKSSFIWYFKCLIEKRTVGIHTASQPCRLTIFNGVVFTEADDGRIPGVAGLYLNKAAVDWGVIIAALQAIVTGLLVHTIQLNTVYR